MKNSERYSSLKDRLDELGKNLLPNPDPNCDYSIKDEDLTKAYCVLSHAEIEAYFEDIVYDLVSRAFNEWENDNSLVSPVIFHLAINYNNVEWKKKDKKTIPPYSTMVSKSYHYLTNSIIKGNDGIKEKNLKKLFSPIGFEINDALQNMLNALGSNRGDIAHNSSSKLKNKLNKHIDPVTQEKEIKQILKALGDFDNALNKYCQIHNTNPTMFGVHKKSNRLIEIYRHFKSFFTK